MFSPESAVLSEAAEKQTLEEETGDSSEAEYSPDNESSPSEWSKTQDPEDQE